MKIFSRLSLASITLALSGGAHAATATSIEQVPPGLHVNVSQAGNGHSASIDQRNASKATASVTQTGIGSEFQAIQSGSGTHLIAAGQFGQGNVLDLRQTASVNVAIAGQTGNGNQAQLTQAGQASALLTQTGDGNRSTLVQSGAGNTAIQIQQGSSNEQSVRQMGVNNYASYTQIGSNLPDLAILQTGGGSAEVIQTRGAPIAPTGKR